MKYCKAFMSRLALGVFLLPLLAMGIQESKAQSLNIGYTDQELIIAQMPEYRNVLEQLQEFAEGGQEEYMELVEQFNQRLEDYQRKHSILSEEARQTREQELTEMQANIQQFLQQKEAEMGERELELIRPLLERVEGAINDVASERELDLVFGVRAGQVPIILYSADDSMDITADVMTRLGLAPSDLDDLEDLGATP